VKVKQALLPVMLATLMGAGCAEPKFSLDRVSVGMTEDQVVGLLGKPTATEQQGGMKDLDYETYDQDKWFGVGRKENIQQFYVRLVDGRVASSGKKDGKGATWTPLPRAEVVQAPKAVPMNQVELPAARPAAPATFDLRSELEKLEKLKKDGLITEPEFRELRQRALDKAKAQ
jgi:hypothetical protein